MHRAPVFCQGRSPRARGRRDDIATHVVGPGSIPACAGETPEHKPCNPRLQVDPRVRGGDSSRHGGSMRGMRSIPACAGETAWDRDRRLPRKVDPRVRGGDLVRGDQRFPLSGRSPRARGRPVDSHCAGTSPRSIPACAGETLRVMIFYFNSGVDPRVRGGDRESMEP